MEKISKEDVIAWHKSLNEPISEEEIRFQIEHHIANNILPREEFSARDLAIAAIEASRSFDMEIIQDIYSTLDIKTELEQKEDNNIVIDRLFIPTFE